MVIAVKFYCESSACDLTPLLPYRYILVCCLAGQTRSDAAFLSFLDCRDLVLFMFFSPHLLFHASFSISGRGEETLSLRLLTANALNLNLVFLFHLSSYSQTEGRFSIRVFHLPCFPKQWKVPRDSFLGRRDCWRLTVFCNILFIYRCRIEQELLTCVCAQTAVSTRCTELPF